MSKERRAPRIVILAAAASMALWVSQSDVRAGGFHGNAREQIYRSAQSMKAAQACLKQRGYYKGSVDGEMNSATRLALKQFQQSRNIPVTGELDLNTALQLMIVNEAGKEALALELNNPRASVVGDELDKDAIRVSVEAHTPGGKWMIFTDHFSVGDTLHFYVRGVPPPEPSSVGLTEHFLSETYHYMTGVKSVVFHSSDQDITVWVNSADSGAGRTNKDAVDERLIAFLAHMLLLDYQRDLHLRSKHSQMVLDAGRTFKQGEIDLLSELVSVAAVADLYVEIIGRTSEPAATGEAAAGLRRRADSLSRLIEQGQSSRSLTFSEHFLGDWKRLSAELSHLKDRASIYQDKGINPGAPSLPFRLATCIKPRFCGPNRVASSFLNL